MRRRRAPGAARERTVLSWNRTALGVVTFAALAVHGGARTGRTALVVAGLLVGGLAAAVWAVGRSPTGADAPLTPRRAAVASGTVVVAGLVASVAALLPRG